jgi:hypothetical protein
VSSSPFYRAAALELADWASRETDLVADCATLLVQHIVRIQQKTRWDCVRTSLCPLFRRANGCHKQGARLLAVIRAYLHRGYAVPRFH